MKEPLLFNLVVPVNKPTEEEVALFAGEDVEPFLKSLIESEHLNAEEAAAYAKFVAELGGSFTFLLDEFLRVYRQEV